VGQQEGGEVVALDGGLVAVRGPAIAADDAAGVVRQDVDLRVRGEQVIGQPAYVVEGLEVGAELAGLGALRGVFHPPHGGGEALGVATDHHDFVALGGQLLGGGEADAGARARDHDGPIHLRIPSFSSCRHPVTRNI
jgi:hypothetical protein